MRGCFGGSMMVSDKKLYYLSVSMFLVDSEPEELYSSKPRIMPDEGCGGSCKRAPPQASNAISLNALTKQGGPTSTLHLEGCLKSIDRSENHSKGGSASQQD
jgi:hypothetical protein